MKSKILLFLVQANYIIEFVTVYTLNTLKVIVGFIFVLSSFVILYNFLNNFQNGRMQCQFSLQPKPYTLMQNVRHFSILLFTCKIAFVASFKAKYSFEFQF